MVEDPDYIFDSQEGGLTTPEFQKVQNSKFYAAIHNTLYSICGYFPSIIILGGTSFVPFLFVMLTDETVAPMPEALIAITVLIPLCIFLSSIGYTVYSIGMWMRKYSKGCWERAVPPHENVNGSSISDIIYHILFGYENTFYQANEEEGGVFLSFTISIFAVFLIVLLCSISIAILGDELGFVEGFERMVGNDGDIEFDGTISVFAASLSVLLGAVFGLITLGIFMIAISPFDAFMLIFVVALPSIISAPLFKNFVWYSRYWHYEQSGLATGRNIMQLSVLSAIYIALFAFILIFLNNV